MHTNALAVVTDSILCRWPNPMQAGAFSCGLFGTAIAWVFSIAPHTQGHLLSTMMVFVCLPPMVYMYWKLMTMDPGYTIHPTKGECTDI